MKTNNYLVFFTTVSGQFFSALAAVFLDVTQRWVNVNTDLRDNTYHRIPTRLKVAIPSSTVKSKLFTRGPLSFFLGFGRDCIRAKTVSQSDFKIQSGIAFSKFYSFYSFWSVYHQLSQGNEFRVSIFKDFK